MRFPLSRRAFFKISLAALGFLSDELVELSPEVLR